MPSPVMPIEKYCEALRTWSHLIQQQYKDDKHKPEWVNHVHQVFLNIRKSNLLYRMLYVGEKPRERPCPIHKGRWGGIQCFAGCGGCGWLPDCEKCEGRGWVAPHVKFGPGPENGGRTDVSFTYCDCDVGEVLKHHATEGVK